MPSPQSTRWCFTGNNPTQELKDAIVALGGNLELIKYLVVGRETGESGTPHLQGFVIFTRKCTRVAVSRILPRTHLEQARGSSSQAATYCKKEGDFDEYGSCPGQPGANGVLEPFYQWGDAYVAENGYGPSSPEIAREHPTVYLRYPRCVRLFQNRAPAPVIRDGTPGGWQEELETELDGEPDDRSILFYVDPDGGKGKSWFQQYYISKYPEKAQVLSVGKRDDIAHYVDETKSIFFFNIPRGGMEFMQYTILEQIKDRMIFSPKYNSRTKILRSKTHVVVFCNEDPDHSKMTEDRYVIRNI